MKPFRERNPVIVGMVSIGVLVLLFVATFRLQDLPIIGGGTIYRADFSEAGGLKEGDEVRIAGVRVGKVESIELDGDHVEVAFRITSDAEFGPDTRAQVKVQTILGSMFLALEPEGEGQLDADDAIPLERTTSSFDVVDAFSGLAETAEDIDTDQLADSLTTIADLTRTTPESFQKALDGVSALSENIAARDGQINSLLKNLNRVSGVLDERDDDIIKLMEDSDVLFRELVARRAQVHDLLTSTAQLSDELTQLVRGSREDLAPALAKLESVLAVLNKNEDNLDNSLRLMAPFYRVFASTLGSGPWFDTFIYNLPPIPNIPNGGVS
ncbi:MCE family protein [Nocardioides sp. R-C-SC26]|uniref:MCE family protein n=1 Tax=Nocardioides sp. R-C-SC26 TaxID=2870414 RepID=UPI001E5FE493|nr:MCE family protein [Nocardioides sp. R-C-SC26]